MDSKAPVHHVQLAATALEVDFASKDEKNHKKING